MAANPQPEFDFEHHLPAGKESFSMPWLARWFETSQQHWINLVESGAFGEGAVPDLKSPNATKTMYRIPRKVLLTYLNKQSSVVKK